MPEIINNPIDRNHEDKIIYPIGCIVHETAVPGATDTNIRNSFENSFREASAHFSVDWDSITIIVPYGRKGNKPWAEKAWHAGGPIGNSLYMGGEICRPKTHDPGLFAKTWDNATWYWAFLFVNIFGFNTVTKENCPSHHEITLKYRESTHTDPDAYFAEYGKTIDDFRLDVQKYINKMIGGNSMDPKKIVIVPAKAADFPAALQLAMKYHLPVVTPDDIHDDEDAVQIGGGPDVKPGCKKIFGADRDKTFEAIIGALKNGI